MTRHLKAAVAVLAGCSMFFTGCGTDVFVDMVKQETTKENLSSAVPEMDASSYNRFLFDINITAWNTEGSCEEFSQSGVLELYGGISHMYDLDIRFSSSGYETEAETWADFGSGIRYTDLGDGFMPDTVDNGHAIDDLVDAISHVTGKDAPQSCIFSTDSSHLFREFMEPYVTDLEFSGDGRITAVFDPVTGEFKYFTIVVSASNREQEGVLLDAVFYWDEKNSSTDILQIPEDVSKNAYKAATGVSTSGGYDMEVNPVAEDFINVYGGAAEVACYDDGAAMFWTKQDEGMSAVVNYATGKEPQSRFEDNYGFLSSRYGSPAEKTDNGAYFYDASSGELTYIAHADGYYAEIIITGSPGMTQGQLRKPLITYKSRLGV